MRPCVCVCVCVHVILKDAERIYACQCVCVRMQMYVRVGVTCPKGSRNFNPRIQLNHKPSPLLRKPTLGTLITTAALIRTNSDILRVPADANQGR